MQLIQFIVHVDRIITVHGTLTQHLGPYPSITVAMRHVEKHLWDKVPDDTKFSVESVVMPGDGDYDLEELLLIPRRPTE